MNDNILFANEGDKIVTKAGNVYTFIKLKRTKFIGRGADGNLYDISVQSFDKIIEKAPEKKLNQSYLKLKKGDLFWINHKDSACLFRFVEIKKSNGRILGLDCIHGTKTTIDVALYGGTIEELPH